MKYIDHFKFFSPFFKEKATRIIDAWTTEMNQFAIKVAAEQPACSIAEARTIWLMYKLAELQAININSEIANDLKQSNQ